MCDDLWSRFVFYIWLHFPQRGHFTPPETIMVISNYNFSSVSMGHLSSHLKFLKVFSHLESLKEECDYLFMLPFSVSIKN